MIWFTSDIHFGHRNVIQYCNRPYDSVEEMDKKLIEQWNSQVSPEDKVYFLGDFGINKKKTLDPEFVNALNGKKTIILGNHDTGFVRCHKNPEKLESIRNQYQKAGWEDVYTSLLLYLKNGQECLLTHLPPDNGIDNRYREFKKEKAISTIHLHGHLHGWYRKNGNMVDVAFDGDLKLLSEDEIINIINDTRDFIPTRLTEHYQKECPLMLKPFEEEVKKGNIRKMELGDLVIYNYTDQCTYDKEWNEITRIARGIIFEKNTGKLVACAFPKFFNLGEMPETRLENLPSEDYEVYEKMDGSLGIIYNYNDEWRVATRGSLNSDQALKAQEILKKYNLRNIPKHYTILVEIIYPENKIVVNYGDKEELVLLAVNDLSKEEELPRERVSAISFITGMPLCKAYNYTIEEMIELQKTIPKDQEGFIVRFRSGLRLKIKGDEYFKIHKMISHVTPLAFWESMENGKVKLDYLQELPEEYRKDADQITEKLETQYKKIRKDSYLEYLNVSESLFRNKGEVTRKDIGLYIKNNNPKYGYLYFQYLDRNNSYIDQAIMKKIRPDGNNFVEEM